jgi:FkbM family methyltransferase
MVTVHQVLPVGRAPRLGEEVRFAPNRNLADQIQYFLEHDGVLYPQPLTAEADGSVRMYPEAPGRYTLYAAWRIAADCCGWTQASFAISGPANSVPQEVRLKAGHFWAPTAWDRATLAAHELGVLRQLKRLLKPGMTIYDVGANIGVYSSHFIGWIGSQGWLYAVEPNPVCVAYLRTNLEQTKARNYSVLPLALSKGPCTIRFTINYGSSMIGIGSDSPQAGKPGHTIQVEGESLDRLINRLNLRKPHFIKVDVEGAEASAIGGMLDTLMQARPLLMIEFHGRTAASDTLPLLAPLNYRFTDASTATTYATGSALLDAMPEACVQVIGVPPDPRS